MCVVRRMIFIIIIISLLNCQTQKEEIFLEVLLIEEIETQSKRHIQANSSTLSIMLVIKQKIQI